MDRVGNLGDGGGGDVGSVGGGFVGGHSGRGE